MKYRINRPGRDGRYHDHRPGRPEELGLVPGTAQHGQELQSGPSRFSLHSIPSREALGFGTIQGFLGIGDALKGEGETGSR